MKLLLCINNYDDSRTDIIYFKYNFNQAQNLIYFNNVYIIFNKYLVWSKVVTLLCRIYL